MISDKARFSKVCKQFRREASNHLFYVAQRTAKLFESHSVSRFYGSGWNHVKNLEHLFHHFFLILENKPPLFHWWNKLFEINLPVTACIYRIAFYMVQRPTVFAENSNLKSIMKREKFVWILKYPLPSTYNFRGTGFHRNFHVYKRFFIKAVIKENATPQQTSNITVWVHNNETDKYFKNFVPAEAK